MADKPLIDPIFPHQWWHWRCSNAKVFMGCGLIRIVCKSQKGPASAVAPISGVYTPISRRCLFPPGLVIGPASGWWLMSEDVHRIRRRAGGSAGHAIRGLSRNHPKDNLGSLRRAVSHRDWFCCTSWPLATCSPRRADFSTCPFPGGDGFSEPCLALLVSIFNCGLLSREPRRMYPEMSTVVPSLGFSYRCHLMLPG